METEDNFRRQQRVFVVVQTTVFYTILGVFTTREGAEAFINSRNNCEIHETSLDPVNRNLDISRLFQF